MKNADFSEKIVRWYVASHRDLPWRNTQDPYKIWLSEIILQQTRVAQGLPYYKKFISNYPNVKSLAAASEQEVLRLWQGLGYYTRARNLHLCAKMVAKDFGGKFPDSWEELKKLPGIGDYTAAAIASFAFNQKVAVVDGNVYRVLARIFGIDKDTASFEGKRYFSGLANELIPVSEPGHHNQAMMEFGATHCLPQNPKCPDCIFRRQCYAFQHEAQAFLPVKRKKKAVTKRYFYYFIIRDGNKVLMNRRTQKDIWKGLFDFPMWEEKRAAPAAKVIEKVLQSMGIRSGVYAVNSKEYKHLLTHQEIRARFVEVDGPATKSLLSSFVSGVNTWYLPRQIEKLPKPRLITRYLEDSCIS